MPITLLPLGTSFVTKELAPTITSFDILMFWRTTAPIPTKVKSPTFTVPASFTPGAIWQPLPMILSCSTNEELFMIVPSPMIAPVFITLFAKTTVPSPSLTLFAITELGWIAVKIEKPKSLALFWSDRLFPWGRLHCL